MSNAETVSSQVDPVESQPVDAISFIERNLTRTSAGALSLATLEAICLAVISVGKAGVALGLASFLSSVAFWHSGPLRIPLLILAFLGASVNVYAVWRRWRLRSAPSAAWRKRPFTVAERRRTILVLASSFLTYVLVIAEAVTHHVLHG